MMKRVASRVAVAVLAVTLTTLLATPLVAQRAEIAVLAGVIQSADEEFDRSTSGSLGPPSYTRERGVREAGSAFGLAATFAIRGHWFGEIGVLHHGVDRKISRTGTGDASGPFILTTSSEGTITSLWMGPAYRFVDRERVGISALLAPALFIMQGDAYSESQVFYNAPSRSTVFGIVAGLRARYWATERLGIQLSVDDAVWTYPLLPHPSEGSPMTPDAYRKTPAQHDIRVHLGAAIRLR